MLEITQNIVRNWEKIGPGPLTLSTVPETTDLWQATIGAIAVACVAFAYQLSPLGRKLRAAREDPFAAQAAGIDVHRQRLWAFALSGALSGFAGGLFVHFQGTINVQDVFLDFTFLSLAMLVVGGVGQPLGRGRRRAARQRARLVPRRRGERRRELAARAGRARAWSSSRRSWCSC